MAIGTPVCIGTKNHSQGSPWQITTNAPVPSGALVVLLFSTVDTGSTITWNGFAQAGGLTWTLDVDETEGDTGVVYGSGSHFHLALSAPAPSGLSSSTTIEMNVPTTTSNWGVTWSLHYIEGIDLGASRFDNYKWGTTLGNDTNWTTSTASITANDAILLSQSLSDGSNAGSTGTVTSPANEITGSDQEDTGNEWHSVCGYLITSSSGTYGISGTVSDSHNFGASAFFAAYKAAGAISLGGEGGGTGSSTTVALTTTSPAPSGSKIIVALRHYDGAETSTMSGGGLTWRKDWETRNGSVTVAIHSADAPSGLALGTTLTATITGSGGQYRVITAMYATGLQTGDVDYGGTSGNNTAAGWSSGNTTVTSGDLLIGAAAFSGSGSPTSTATSGNAEVHDYTLGSGESFTTVWQLSSGSIAATGTWTASPSAGHAVAVVYPAAATSQILLPDADTSAGSWGTAPLFSKINDSSDATVITDTLA